MRIAKISDVWRKIENSEFNIELKINDEDFLLNERLNIITGMNGCGKTTFLNSLKSIFGLRITKTEVQKIQDLQINLSFKTKKYRNLDGERVLDKNTNLSIIDLDPFKIIEELNQLISQDELEEYLNQFEIHEYPKEEVTILKYLLQKNYENVKVMEVLDDDKSVYFFEVITKICNYNSTKMGMGEYVMLYYYHKLQLMEENSVVFIEEPENFINVKSQKNFLNYLVQVASKKKLTIFLTTHSPFLIEEAFSQHIHLLKYEEEGLKKEKFSKVLTLKKLGLEPKIQGYFLVEDKKAEALLTHIIRIKNEELLKKYPIKSLDGHSDISKIMMTSKEIGVNFIGIYDFDMKEKKSEIKSKSFNHKHFFLPGIKENIEEDLIDILAEEVDVISKNLKINQETLRSLIDENCGENYHDYFSKISKELNVPEEVLIEILLIKFSEKNKKIIENFYEELKTNLNF